MIWGENEHSKNGSWSIVPIKVEQIHVNLDTYRSDEILIGMSDEWHVDKW